MAFTTTANIGLRIPATNDPSWDVQADYDFNRLDALLSAVIALPALSISGTVSAGSLSTGTIAGGAVSVASLSASGNVSVSGTLTANAFTLSGTLTIGALSTTGAVGAASVTTSGAITAGGVLTGASIVTSGSLSAGSIATGSLSASSATISGAVSTGALSATSVSAAGAVAAASVSATNVTVTGTLTAAHLSIVGYSGQIWKKYTITLSGGNWLVNGVVAAALSSSGTTQQIPLFNSDARMVFNSLVVKHSVAFAATGAVGITASVGTAASPDTLMIASGDLFDIKQSPGDTVFYVAGGGKILSFGSVGVVLQVIVNNATPSALYAGVLEIDVLYSDLP